MSIVIDICLVVVFVGFVVTFTKHGFARTVYKIGKTWLSFFSSIVLGPFVSSRIQEWFLEDMISNGIYKSLSKLVATNPNGYNLAELFEKLPQGFVRFLENFDVSLPLLEMEYGSATEATDEIIRAISQNMAVSCAEFIASVIGYIFCFVVTLVFFAWLNFQIRKHRIGFFRVLDQIIGFIAGVAIGFCAVFGISVLMHVIFQIIVAFNVNTSVISIYDKSFIFKFLAEFDLIGTLKQLM